MDNETSIIKAFVTGWTEKTVTYYCYRSQETRMSDIIPLFQNMEMFKGKNIWFEIKVVPGSMTTKNNESDKSRIAQLWNYYVRGKF